MSQWLQECNGLENRIIDIETKIAYQEDTIEQLNQVVTAQQKKIAQLQTELEFIKNWVQTQRSSQMALESEEQLPPHYWSDVIKRYFRFYENIVYSF